MAEGPTRSTLPVDGRWRSRPVLSFAVRAATVVIPAAAAAASAWAIGSVFPAPGGLAAIGWWASLLLITTLVAVVVERLARRLLPLAALLQLSLAFPDHAPSRFKMARGAGNVRQLEERIREARERGIDDDPARAAEQILQLVAALSAHDRKTRGHSERVRAYADMLADELQLPPLERDRLRWAALLHDVGKLRVPERILNKPGKPDEYEWELLKEHPEAGARIVAPLAAWLGPWADTIPQHHERVDGRGYPHGLEGHEISLGARIVAVADSFEVMTAARAYKKPMPVPVARRELAACAGKQFDPEVVRAFFSISIGRLWWTVGPTSWVAVTPVLGMLQRAGAQAAIAAKSAAVVGMLSVGGVVNAPVSSATPTPSPALAGDAEAAPEPAPRTAASTTTDGGTDADDDAGSRDRDRDRDRDGPGKDGGGDGGDDGDGGSGGEGGGGGGSGGGGGGGSGGTGTPPPSGGGGLGGTVDDVAGTVDDTVEEVEDTVDDVVGGVGGAVDGVTGAVGGVTGGVTGGLGGL